MSGKLSTMPWLHIYGQFGPHGAATITGTHAGLIALRDALTEALENGSASTSAFTSDGEGYGIAVARSNLRNLGRLPYLESVIDARVDDERKRYWRILTAAENRRTPTPPANSPTPTPKD